MRKRLFLLVAAVVMLAGATSVAADSGGSISCETYFGCRRFDYGGTIACRCDSLSTCTECCDTVTLDCWVS